MNGKSDEQIVRDDARRQRLSHIGFGTGFATMLLFIISVRLGIRISSVTFYAFIGVFISGVLVAAYSSRCPICDSGINRDGSCMCRRNKMERSLYLYVLKRKVAKANVRDT
jgi:hypothetical protein